MSTGPFAVRADLTLQADGVTARLTGDGDRLTLDASDPWALWRSAAALPWPVGPTVSRGPSVLGEIGSALAARGLHVDVTGPGGRVAELGAGVASPLGRLLTGSAAVRPGSPRTVATTVSAGVTASPGGRRAVGLGLAALLAAVVLGRRRR
ncbi:hypothetical protein [Klenkia brasiliensis]|uniref:Uncharacterized protein n=1 Tax=Klenkia brasiliensis TaxID=333142 RepID=A0A1G7STB6_9ACTN|nr:hypothetical protein [Klenkia brasiliensis]SDG26317.1 hypothetical protein SAMN05660324_2161 [Klenkia brasiliensis]